LNFHPQFSTFPLNSQDHMIESVPTSQASPSPKTFLSGLRPFRVAIWQGLAVLLPPLLTIVIFLWAGGVVKSYVLDPLFFGSRYVLIVTTAHIVPERSLPATDRGKPTVKIKGIEFSQVRGDRTYVPTEVLDTVHELVSGAEIGTPLTGLEVYQRYVEQKYLKPHLFFPVFCVLFILLVYLIGKFIAVGIGRFLWIRTEKIVEMVPLVREVYGAVKQVSDFILAERTVQFSRVVAVEWPRKGVWSLAFVTSEGLTDIEKAAGEPVYCVLIPTSPMPVTGFTMHVKRSETIELSITLDQALQVVVSCGVVVPRRGGAFPEVLDVVQRTIADHTE